MNPEGERPDVNERVRRIEEAARSSLTWQEASSGADAVAAALELATSAPAHIVELLGRSELVVFTAAGSSLCLASSAAAALRQVTRRSALAVPLTEILLRPDSVFPRGRVEEQLVVVVSRTGATTEALRVAALCGQRGHRVLAVTCRPGSPLALAVRDTFAVARADEKAVVMTRSFPSMLALLLRIVADVAGDRTLAGDLESLPARWRDTADAVHIGWDIAAARQWQRVVVLGGGAARGIADEGVMKITEMSRVPVNSYEPLEFRHGPIALCEPGVLIMSLLGGDAEAEERRVAAECAALGASSWIVGAHADPVESGVQPSALRVETSLGEGLHELARLPLLMPAVHALAFGLTVARGLDADRPRNLGQVVLLE